MRYSDRSLYAGDMVDGERHGHGVSSSGSRERYEGSWANDLRDGYGLTIGGAYRFLFGRYKNGEPVGQHVAWDFHTDFMLLAF
jgi:hypothetical protein